MASVLRNNYSAFLAKTINSIKAKSMKASMFPNSLKKGCYKFNSSRGWKMAKLYPDTNCFYSQSRLSNTYQAVRAD